LNVVAERIEAEIKHHGAIPFARFMDLALYCPDYGYYEKENDNPGRRGDFYTSVSVGPLLGELLAFQFAEWLAEIPAGLVQIVEAGAHDGRLAADILRWLARRRPELLERVQYVICEPSGKRRSWQREKLKAFPQHVRWLETELEQIVPRINGVIFGNEFLDALPVHRVGWDAQRQEWFEWGVTVERGRFVWTRLTDSHVLSKACRCSRRLTNLPDELLTVLPDNFTSELCPAAETWWRRAGMALQTGRLLTLDYGLSVEEFLQPQRSNGTLRAYRSHRLADDVLADPGKQDITAHIDFSGIQKAGESVGLKTETFATQGDFLTGILKRFWVEAERAGDWTARRSRELQTLIHPSHLGRAFQVLVQTRSTNQSGTD
jgi:SAM-dependent MidA family methyltransferase